MFQAVEKGGQICRCENAERSGCRGGEGKGGAREERRKDYERGWWYSAGVVGRILR